MSLPLAAFMLRDYDRVLRLEGVIRVGTRNFGRFLRGQTLSAPSIFY
jgi:hypothetical protein